MTDTVASPDDVAGFHAAYDHHTDDRVRLFRALREVVSSPSRVLYAGSYVDVAPSIWFDDVSYVDVDRRAARWFSHTAEVDQLIADKRQRADGAAATKPAWAFYHADYQQPLPIQDASLDLLVSLYAGFISEHCTRYLRPGGMLLANDSHGDASMAALDPGYQLLAVVISHEDDYRLCTDDLASYRQPKRGPAPTSQELHRTNRGIAYTKSPFAYIFQREG
ncbi:MAG: hypothetical protein WA962_07280 [Ornithinimicrobium sp.]